MLTAYAFESAYGRSSHTPDRCWLAVSRQVASRRSGSGLLGPSLVPVCVLAVHELRFLAAYGSGAGAELADTGHSYLHELTPWIVLACSLGFGAFLACCARAWRSGDADRRRRSFFGLWLLAAAGLVGIYGVQEFLEGLFATGHPSGLAGIFGDGGLWAVPAALVVGALLALVVRGARTVVAVIARRAARRNPVRRVCAPLSATAPVEVFLAPIAPLARSLAGRGPPGALR